MGAGKEGPSEQGACSTFVVCSYTDIDVLAHLPKGEVATVSSVTLVRCSENGNLSVGSGVMLPSPNPAFALKHPEQPLLYVSTECIDKDGEIFTLSLDNQGNALKVISKQTTVRPTPCDVDSGHYGQLAGPGRLAYRPPPRHPSPPLPQAGKSTCFLQLDQELKNLLAVSYWDAKVATLPVSRETGELAGPRHCLQTPGAEYVQKTTPGRVEHWQYRRARANTHLVPYIAIPRCLHAWESDTRVPNVVTHTPSDAFSALQAAVAAFALRGAGALPARVSLRHGSGVGSRLRLQGDSPPTVCCSVVGSLRRRCSSRDPRDVRRTVVDIFRSLPSPWLRFRARVIPQLDQTEGKLMAKAAVNLEKGRGPRHLLFHPRARVAYVVSRSRLSLAQSAACRDSLVGRSDCVCRETEAQHRAWRDATGRARLPCIVCLQPSIFTRSLDSSCNPDPISCLGERARQHAHCFGVLARLGLHLGSWCDE